MENCAICNKEVDTETAAVLAIGAFGTPKYLCPECENEIDTALTDTDFHNIGAAMDAIGKKMADNEYVGKVVFSTVNELFDKARDRATKIKEGTYDFSLDNQDSIEEGDGEVPEELLESEEDRELDRREIEKEKKVNRVIDWITGIAFTAAFAVIAYMLIDRFF